MSVIVYNNAVLLVNGRDVSGEFHDLGLTYTADAIDKTAFGMDTHQKLGGLLASMLTGTAHADYAALAIALLYTLLPADSTPYVIFPNGVTEGTACGYAAKGVVDMFDLSGGDGTIQQLKFQIESQGVQT